MSQEFLGFCLQTQRIFTNVEEKRVDIEIKQNGNYLNTVARRSIVT